jgi:hypothetical protein
MISSQPIGGRGLLAISFSLLRASSIERRSPSKRAFQEVITMEFKEALIDVTKEEDTRDTPLFIGNNNRNDDENANVRFAWKMVAYLKKEGIERLSRKQNIDTRNVTEEDYKRIAAIFFTIFMESERYKAVADYLIETAIRLHMSERESPPSKRRWC